jgi:hypothetical protein
MQIGCVIDAVGVCRASAVEVLVKDGAVEIMARQAPLIEVLKKLTEKTGCNLTTGDALKEVVTLNLKMGSIEACIRRLLADRSYAMYYTRLEDQGTALTEIRVLGGDPPIAYGAQAQSEAPPPDDRVQSAGRTWYETKFSTPGLLAKQIKVRKVRNPSDTHPLHPSGIQMIKVPENSVFNQIGIKKGDIIKDVNGTPVGSSEQLVNAMQMASDSSPPIIRLERLDINGEMDPIYIELH